MLEDAKPVQMNVRSIPIQIIVDNVPRYVANVQKNVGFKVTEYNVRTAL